MRAFITLLLGAATAQNVQQDDMKKFVEYNQRACPWSEYVAKKDWNFFTKDNDDPATCAAACLATKGCTGFEVGPRTSHAFNDIMYCALWFNGNCNDVSKMLNLGGYKAKTFVLPSALPNAITTAATTTVPSGNVVEELIEGIVKTAEKVENIEKTVQNFDSALEKEEKSFEQAAKKQPLLLFKALYQRACPWSKYTKGKDWSFASQKSDNKEECARACVAEKGCTGFEVGPSTSSAYKSITYCALWFNSKCGDENDMLILNPMGYVATTFVMLETVTVRANIKESTLLGSVAIQKTKTFQPSESKKHYHPEPEQKLPETGVDVVSTQPRVSKEHYHPNRENLPQEALEVVSTTVDSASSIVHFDEFPQLACAFDQYKEGSDWKYATATSSDAESCASTCLNTDDCTGFEIGIETKRGQYCALWISGSCSTKKSMTVIPADYQTVSTFVLSDYHQETHVLLGGFTIVFLILCACALLISILLVACICYKVCKRVFRHRANLRNTRQTVVPGELVQSKVVRGMPVGERVDVVVLRGEAVNQK